MKIRVIAASDNMRKEYTWQDYWIKRGLVLEFASRGYEVVGDNADVDIFLHGRIGWNGDTMSAPRRFMWFLGHPDDATNRMWFSWASMFEHIWCMSSNFIQYLYTGYSKNISLLIGGVVSEKFYRRTEEPSYDIAFIGNSKEPRTEIVRYLKEQKRYKMCIAGSGWQSCDWLQSSFAGIFVKPEKVPNFYNDAKITFYSTHDDMRRNGFLGTKVFDVFSSSECLCIHEKNDGLDDVFRYIPKFTDKEELVYLIDYYLTNTEERERIVIQCREDVEKLKFKYVVDKMLEVIDG